MPKFEVNGKGRDSGRGRKRTYSATDEISAREMAAADGTDIETIEELPPDPATQRQIDYARDLGITIPTGATKDELSDLISCSTDDDLKSSPELLSLAQHYNIEVTIYTGQLAVHNRIFHFLSSTGREQELAAWFAFNVLQGRPKARTAAGNIAPDNPRLSLIGSKLAADDKVMLSIKRYSESTLLWFGERTQKDGWVRQGGSNRTAAYKAAAELIDNEFESAAPTPRPQRRRVSSRGELKDKSKRRRAAKKSGPSVATVTILVLIFLFVLGLIF